MNNLQSKIGLRPLDDGTREFVDDLTGVDYNLLAAIATDAEKAEDGGDGVVFLWDKVKREQYKALKSRMLAEFAKRANFQEVADRTRPPSLVNTPNTTIPGVDTWHGVIVTMPNSRYQSVFIHGLFARVDLADTVARIYTESGGQIGEDIPLDLSKGQAQLIALDIPLDAFSSEQIAVAVKIPAGTTLEAFNAQLETKYTRARPVSFADGGSPDFSELAVSLSYTYVSADFEIRMNLDRVIDAFADRLARSYMMMCGCSILEKVLYSKKANESTQINRTGMMENYLGLEERLKEELAGTLRSIYNLVRQETLALIANPQDQPGNYVVDAF